MEIFQNAGLKLDETLTFRFNPKSDHDFYKNNQNKSNPNKVKVIPLKRNHGLLANIDTLW